MNKRKKVICAMSGGVDSSVAAALLKRGQFLPAGRQVEVVGVFMKFWSGEGRENSCCSLESEVRARKVAKILGIPFYVFNFEKEFKKRIVDYFLAEYQKGDTPNPCVVCNKEIKFGLLLEKALALDANYIATGHYARKKENLTFSTGVQKVKYRLLRGKDKEKDQSYFLWQLNQKQLKHILFPVGNYTKTEVREMAKSFKLPVLNIPESMEICFIPDTLNNFLARYLKTKSGPIFTAEGKRIGQHQGLPFYTIGQRKGIELAGGPYYVVAKDFKKNTLIVTHFLKDSSLYRKSLIAKNINWISGQKPKLPLKVEAQIRYGHQAVSAIITKGLSSKSYTLKLNQSQRAVTPGQSVVFYRKDRLLGGGIID